MQEKMCIVLSFINFWSPHVLKQGKIKIRVNPRNPMIFLCDSAISLFLNFILTQLHNFVFAFLRLRLQILTCQCHIYC